LIDRGDENRQRGQQGSQQHQRQAQAVQAQIQSQPQFRQPGLVEVAGGIPPTEQPQQQLQQRRPSGRKAKQARALLGQQRQQQSHGQGDAGNN
jgi:hypothetical protein